MSQAENHHKINYIEFAATDVARAKQIYAAVFGWSFQDWGPDYISFEAAHAGVHGGRPAAMLRPWSCFTPRI